MDRWYSIRYKCHVSNIIALSLVLITSLSNDNLSLKQKTLHGDISIYTIYMQATKIPCVGYNKHNHAKVVYNIKKLYNIYFIALDILMTLVASLVAHMILFIPHLCELSIYISSIKIQIC